MFKSSILYLILVLCLSSCAQLNMYTSEKVIDQTQKLIQMTENYIPVIGVNDKVSVSIWGNEEMSVGSVYGIYNSNEVFGKWLIVDEDSMISLPRVGQVKIGGLNINEAKALLKHKLSNVLKSPIIDIKIHNHKVSVLGQVIKPGNYVVNNDKNSLAYILAEAGGADYYAKLNEVVLARGEISYELDLTSLSSFEMYHIGLLPGDVLYIPTKGGKFLDKKSSALLAVASITTTILLLFTAGK